ncbi:MAG: hypothetical protein EBS54_06415 [Betaproteobacteria bacterium]|nr:hypothetical protein [Betaproteobacteria bacterium]
MWIQIVVLNLFHFLQYLQLLVLQAQQVIQQKKVYYGTHYLQMVQLVVELKLGQILPVLQLHVRLLIVININYNVLV